jgi:hypothetical protein
MTTPRNPESIVTAWLEEGPNELPELTRRAIAVSARSTHQRRRRLISPRWVPALNGTLSRLILAAVAVVVAVGGLQLFGSRSPGPPGGAGGQPSPSPILDMARTFVSSKYGYAIGYPDGWTIQPAASLWWPPTWKATGGSDAPYDRFFSSPDGDWFRAGSADVPEGVSIDGWIDEFITTVSSPPDSCSPPRTDLPEIIIDGQPGRIRDHCEGEVEATVVVGRRAYVLTLFYSGPAEVGISMADARAIFDAFIATIDLRPEDALEVPSPTPS